MEKMITEALDHRGFSLIEAVSNCHTYFGRMNRRGDAVSMLSWFKENSISVGKAKKMTPEELEGKFVLGRIHHIEKTEFCDEYQQLIDSVRGGN
jgi:2-oxoglutarate ferredoxin oxidoreductase subunit beta